MNSTPSTANNNRASHDTDGKASGEYRDFSRAACDGKSQAPPNPAAAPNTKEPTFPVKLHMIMSNADFSDIITWLPHGRSWRILQQKAFEDKVIPLFFRHGRYSSFARQVNGWGFRRITHGSDYNSYYHELFLRGMPHLCSKMRRLTTKDVSERKKQEEGPAPDFYAMHRENPLPEASGDEKVDSVELKETLPSSALQGISALPASLPASALSAIPVLPPSSNVNDVASASPRALAQLELALLERRRAEILGQLNAVRLPLAPPPLLPLTMNDDTFELRLRLLAMERLRLLQNEQLSLQQRQQQQQQPPFVADSPPSSASWLQQHLRGGTSTLSDILPKTNF